MDEEEYEQYLAQVFDAAVEEKLELEQLRNPDDDFRLVEGCYRTLPKPMR